ncbi:MAG: hypothetical protein DI623_11945 [Sphingomonas sanxanigenens]|uniref:Uncharacterized protein n=1 Tax=Sphingomonas sanxanigenens TaxID=397260 RepID=A0A2W5A2M0_9SPHN|nr:MAG: hypothetical protein DI623_11945 [Sphingomonas sanxanigenens]
MSFLTARGYFRPVAALLAVATPLASAEANFFWKAPDLSGPPVIGNEPDIGELLPGATPQEMRAAIVWRMRSALNVGALQCQFDPTLLTNNQYNHLLDYHRVELGQAYQTLTGYFKRTKKAPKLAQTALDQYGTRTYSSFSTVTSQFTFCETISKVGRAALFVPKGQFYTVAEKYLREVRKSLGRYGEQSFVFYVPPLDYRYPPLEEKCWKDSRLDTRHCSF